MTDKRLAEAALTGASGDRLVTSPGTSNPTLDRPESASPDLRPEAASDGLPTIPTGGGSPPEAEPVSSQSAGQNFYSTNQGSAPPGGKKPKRNPSTYNTKGLLKGPGAVVEVQERKEAERLQKLDSLQTRDGLLAVLGEIGLDQKMSGAYRVAALSAVSRIRFGGEEFTCQQPCCARTEPGASVMEWLEKTELEGYRGKTPDEVAAEARTRVLELRERYGGDDA